MHIKKQFFFVFLIFLFFSSLSTTAQASNSTKDIPEPLQAWIPWVLHNNQEAVCTFFHQDGSKYQCGWPGKLVLDISKDKGHFAQTWFLDFPGWVLLPGDSKHWPQNVSDSSVSVAVISRSNIPSVYLEAGTHVMSGDFLWDTPPESLSVPSEVGLISLTLLGQPVSFPERDEDGQLWFNKGSQKTGEEEKMEIRVHRKVTDEIPLLLTTRINLMISGKNRELLFGEPLPKGFIPMSLTSELPARLEKEGQLRVQARSGEWTITLVSRHDGPIDKITLNKKSLAPEEVWVFEAQSQLREVEVSGVPLIDPRQTTLSSDWQQFPTYRLKPEETLVLTQKRRGDENPPADKLNLRRTYWLDFDGKGYTLHDEISGTINRSWRLEANPPLELGRVSIDDEDQFVTHLEGNKARGVEIRQGDIEVNADSRLESLRSRLPAIGWNHDFAQVSGILNLPPGWKLFSASGVDHIPNTWLNHWTLLDLFLVMIIAMIVFKLSGLRWGIVCFATLAITFTEPSAPRWIWLFYLAGETLRRVLPPSRILSLVKIYRFVICIVFVLLAIPFLVQQVRQGMYPALEHSWATMQGAGKGQFSFGGGDKNKEGYVYTGDEPGAKYDRDRAPEPPPSPQLLKKSAPRPANDQNIFEQSSLNIYTHDPKSLVQTGPGLTQWQWNTIPLQWYGPVEKSQTLRLILISPTVNFMLSFLRLFFLASIVLHFLGFPIQTCLQFLKKQRGHMVSLFLFMCLFILSPIKAQAYFPSSEILDSLKQKLLEKPECHPLCASIPRMQLDVTSNHLRLRLEVHAEEKTVIPLPGSLKEWSYNLVLLDDNPAIGLIQREDKQFWLRIDEKGTHQVILEGSLSNQSSISLALPLKPYLVQTGTTSGWSISGIHEDGVPENNLTLTRISGPNTGTSFNFESGSLPPFVKVERNLLLGLSWTVVTRVTRLTPTGAPIVLDIPLLEGESVTSADIRVNNKKVTVSMGPQIDEFSWSSILEVGPNIRLQAPKTASWSEWWYLQASPIWHVNFEGIPPIHQQSTRDPKIPQWQPWPDETLTLAVSRPEGVPGQTITVDRSDLGVVPGLRATEINLDLDVRSSLGGQHFLVLPKGSILKSLTVDGFDQPIHQDGEKITVTLAPGKQNVKANWIYSKGISLFYKTPPVNIGLMSVNSETHINLPENRWPLLLFGPRMGPAVLFWSFMVVMVLVSIGLGKLDFSPLSIRQWILLGIGLTQVSTVEAAVVAGWLLMLGWRYKQSEFKNRFVFDLRQIALVIWSVAALVVLVHSIEQGLLGRPDMQIIGNGSTNTHLDWFQDRALPTLPQPFIFSVPLFVYHIAMLAWALWLAFSLLKWFKFGWKSFSQTALWQPLFKKKG